MSQIKDSFYENTKTIYYNIECPPNIMINNSNNNSIISMKNFNIMDPIFQNTSILFNTNNVDNIIVKLDNKLIKLDFLVHTVNCGNNIREYYGFDTFTNHSCDPNSKVVQITETMYYVVAIKPIKVGDELTQDYMTFDSMLDGTTFECECNSSNCRKIIKG